MTRRIKWRAREADTSERVLFAVDIIMMLLIIINLLFTLFDLSFAYPAFRDAVETISPRFRSYYGVQVHPHFIIYDLYFVIAFVTELTIRWIFALQKRTYTRWYFYPLVHWYDVLGCIPLGGFRWLRLLRVFAITMRLHKMGVIDLRKTILFKQLYKLWEIFLEEVTDRVFINVLEAAKQEIIKESDSAESNISEAIRPHREALAHWVTTRIRHVTETNYLKYRDELKQMIETTVRDAFAASKQMKKMEKIPLVGNQLVHSLEATLEDIAFQLLDSSAKSVYERNAQLYEDALASSLDTLIKEEKDKEVSRIIKQIFVTAIDKLQSDIAGKRWMKV